MGCQAEMISVIVPVYNVESYLERCIDSIINQTYQNLEIILVDDGSTDKSGEICDIYAQRDIRVKSIHKKNGGAATARNKGLKIAKGAYIGFVDSDDYIDPDMYESLLKYLDKEIDIVTCGRYLVYPPNTCGLKRKILCADKVTKYSKVQAIEELIKTEIFAYGVNEKLYRKELFNEIKFPCGRVSEDLPLTYALFNKCRNVVNIGEPKYYNFQRADSSTRSSFRFRRIDYVIFLRDILIDVKKKYPIYQEIAEAKYICGVAYLLRNIQECKDKQQYVDLERRLLMCLRNMKIRVLFNKYLNQEEKRIIIDLMKINS